MPFTANAMTLPCATHSALGPSRTLSRSIVTRPKTGFARNRPTKLIWQHVCPLKSAVDALLIVTPDMPCSAPMVI
jgi:hypothetical protein